MKIAKNVPTAPKNDKAGELNEIFNHNNFVKRSEDVRRAMMLDSEWTSIIGVSECKMGATSNVWKEGIVSLWVANSLGVKGVCRSIWKMS